MCTQQTLQEILHKLYEKMRLLLGDTIREFILYGSYARNEAEEGSDIDVMILTDMGREEVSTLTWKIGEIMGDLVLEYGILVAPIIENREFFYDFINVMPFFRNVHVEGVRISA